jgi:hypothetical protein
MCEVQTPPAPDVTTLDPTLLHLAPHVIASGEKKLQKNMSTQARLYFGLSLPPLDIRVVPILFPFPRKDKA